MKINKTIDAEVNWTIQRVGNWNYRDYTLEKVFTKPIAVIKILDNEIVFRHEDIKELIRAYHEVDVESIKMINNPNINTGQVSSAEESLLSKLKKFIKELEDEAKGIKDSPFKNNLDKGQKELR